MPELVEGFNMLVQYKGGIHCAPPWEKATSQGVDEGASEGLKRQP